MDSHAVASREAFRHRPASWRRTLAVSLAATALCVAAVAVVASSGGGGRDELAGVMVSRPRSWSGDERGGGGGDHGGGAGREQQLAGYADEQQLALFNPHYDLDGPGGDRRSEVPHGRMKLQQGLETALAGARMGHSRLSSHPRAQRERADMLFNPSADPDAPGHTDDSSRFPLEPTALSKKFASRLRLKTQVDMLANRQDLDALNAANHDVKKKIAKKLEAMPAKPTLNALTRKLEEGLKNGADPAKLIAETRHEEEKYHAAIQGVNRLKHKLTNHKKTFEFP
uniref:Uncharacterized protein n=2 Tax=Hemiselmis andersenii TaxID=464988 RepID=A0A7S0TZE9_HEMAN|mmetsp:Transcript_26483/g.61421  ORF Transcript_26483/g.61421 Transcript_26483/m.61421 type:complete len:284 (+) Transcript_26483:48-899(+)